MMNTTPFSIATTTLALVALAGAQGSGMLHFLNGDSLPGKLDALDRDHVTWSSPALEQPAGFLIDQIHDLRLPATIRTPDSSLGHEATITLTNGDVVRGYLASVSDDQIILDTWYADRLVFRRAMVRDLTIREMPDYIYRGPQSIEEWLQSANRQPWTMSDDGALITSRPSSIAKDIPLPEEFTLEFEAQWQGSFRMQLILFSDNPASESPDNGYEVVFQRRSVYIRRCGERQWIGHSNRALELQQNEKARIRIRASSRTGQFAFYVNDRIIDTWSDAQIEPEQLGTALHFVSQDNSPLAISRIDISRWNGHLEEKIDNQQIPAPMAGRGIRWGMAELDSEFDEEPEETEAGTMLLKNGDRIRGTVKSIEDGSITIETPYRDISLPVERLRTLALAPVDLEEPKRENGDVRAWFADGGSMVFRLEGVTDDGASVQGYSQTFGTAVFSLSAFNRMEFNIYDLFREED